MSRYFVWDPQRAVKFIRISDAPKDDAGEELSLFDGKKLAPEVGIYWQVEKVKQIPDFLYSVGLQLLVSERAWRVISEFNVAAVSPIASRCSHQVVGTLGAFCGSTSSRKLTCSIGKGLQWKKSVMV